MVCWATILYLKPYHHPKHLDLTNRGEGYKVNTENPVAFLCNNHDHAEKEIRKSPIHNAPQKTAKETNKNQYGESGYITKSNLQVLSSPHQNFIGIPQGMKKTILKIM